MNNKRKKIIAQVLAAALVVSMALPWTAMTAAAEGEKAGTVTVTDASQLEPYFPDANFRAVVFEAVRDGADGAEGATIEEAIHNFSGEVEADKKGIKDVHGIEHLLKATSVSLKHNEIEEWGFLGGLGKEHYGAQDIDGNWYNVIWDVGGNPFRTLPSDFGGRLEIKASQTTSSAYSEDEKGKSNVTFFRTSAGQSFGGTLNIGRCQLADGTWPAIATINPLPPRILDTSKADVSTDHNSLAYRDVKRSGFQSIGIGAEEELKYWTADEYNSITPGSQSFKYYINPTFWVYDKVTAASALGGNATLIKTDQITGNPVEGAEYSVYKQADNTEVLSGLATGADGKLIAQGLEQGDYYFKETKAPQGYKLNQDKVEFSISVTTTGVLPDTKVEGGKDSITTTDGSVITPSANERLIAGPNGANNESPDISLVSDKEDEIHLVRVAYSRLEKADGTAEDNVIRTFDSLSEATADINAEKNKNMILGPVSVNAFYTDPSLQTPVEVTTTDEPLATTDVTVTKTWVDPAGFNGTHPDITVRLWQKIGINAETEYKSQVLANGTTQHTFTNLPAETEDGTQITYSVTEDKAAGYKDPVINGTNITNTFENTQETSISGEKKWSDYNNALNKRPAEVVVGVYKKTDLNNAVDTKSVQADANGEWKFTFDNLPMYEDSGSIIEYAVKEVTVPADYTAKVEGTTITNTLDKSRNEIVQINLEKLWDDGGKAGNRPESIIVSLYSSAAPNKAIREIKLSKADGYKMSVKNLPKSTEDGKEIQYSLKESAIKGYKLAEQTASFDAKNNTWAVKLTNKTSTSIVPPENPKVPLVPGGKVKTGDTSSAWLYIIALAAAALVAGGAIIVRGRAGRKRRNRHKR